MVEDGICSRLQHKIRWRLRKFSLLAATCRALSSVLLILATGSTSIRGQANQPPVPFPVTVTVFRPEIPALPGPFRIGVTIERPASAPAPPGPFPVNVIVERPQLPAFPKAFPISVTVQRPADRLPLHAVLGFELSARGPDEIAPGVFRYWYPKKGGVNIDVCLSYADGCYGEVSDYLCRHIISPNGETFLGSVGWDGEPMSPTRILTGTRTECRGGYCGGITYIDCVVK
jgi:hypothetical protein